MVTAHSERNLIDKAFTAGANDYIVKPFDEIELANRLSGIQVRKGISSQTTSENELRTKIDLDIEIAEVGGLVDPAAMNAYIRALDHGRSSLSMATAFCVENWIELTASLVARQKTEIIRRISSMIHQRLAETTYILSYHGAGIFICVSRKADPHFSAVLGDALKEEAEALQAQLAFLRRTGHSGSLETEIAELVEISMNGSFDQNRRLVEPLRQLPDLFSV